MEETMRGLREAMDERWNYLLHLCELFVADAEPLSQQSNTNSVPPAPRELFRQWLRELVKKNSGALRDVR
jgi:hypothetical protein